MTIHQFYPTFKALLQNLRGALESVTRLIFDLHEARESTSYSNWPPSGLERREKTNYRFTPEQERGIDAEVGKLIGGAALSDEQIVLGLSAHPSAEVLRSVKRVRQQMGNRRA